MRPPKRPCSTKFPYSALRRPALVGGAFRRTLGLSRADLFLRLARHQNPLQANGDRRGLGCASAVSHHAGLHAFFRHGSRTFLRAVCRTRFFITARCCPGCTSPPRLQNATNTIVENQRLITKVYFPRLALPLSSVLSGLVDFGVSFLMFVAMMAYYRVRPTAAILWLPVFCCWQFSRRSAWGCGFRR